MPFLLLYYLYYLITGIYLVFVLLSTVSYYSSAILNILLGCRVLDLLDQEQLLDWFLTISVINHTFRIALTCSI